MFGHIQGVLEWENPWYCDVAEKEKLVIWRGFRIGKIRWVALCLTKFAALQSFESSEFTQTLFKGFEVIDVTTLSKPDRIKNSAAKHVIMT